jgi:hypothetical protein
MSVDSTITTGPNLMEDVEYVQTKNINRLLIGSCPMFREASQSAVTSLKVVTILLKVSYNLLFVQAK